MKVVLFCGGLGLRLREYSHQVPKPMVPVGTYPLLWHVMKYYAHYGHNEFILCLGYRGEAIKQFFLGYNEAIGNDFTLSNGGRTIELVNRDIDDWKITFVDTGLKSNIGERLRRVRPYLEKEEMFLANYSDGLTDMACDRSLDYGREKDRVACVVSVEPTGSFHVVKWKDGGTVTAIEPFSYTARINCGYFAMTPKIFDYMKPGEELVMEPFYRLIGEEQLVTYEYDGFWRCADTYKDKVELDHMLERGETPWMMWKDNTTAQIVGSKLGKGNA